MKLNLTDPRTNWKYIAIVIALGLAAGGGVWWYFQNEKKQEIGGKDMIQKDAVVDWVGVYEYSEFAAPNQTWVYTLQIERQESGLEAVLQGELRIDGFQTLARIGVATREDSINKKQLDILFDHYLPEDIHYTEQYQKGDALFSLEKSTEKEYKVVWDKLYPNLSENKEEAVFIKTEVIDKD